MGGGDLLHRWAAIWPRRLQGKILYPVLLKPLTYAIALESRGQDYVFDYVGREPSGRAFNEMVLDRRREALGKHAVPHNPLINAGAIMSCSLVKGNASAEERINYVMSFWDRLSATKARNVDATTFDQETYEGEAATADRNFCLAYMMKEAGGFPEGVSMLETLQFYFKCCSILQDAEGMSIAAATLANGGVNPLTGERIFNADTVRDTLSLMSSCGMYDYSGVFSFEMGFPSKSGVAGASCRCTQCLRFLHVVTPPG